MPTVAEIADEAEKSTDSRRLGELAGHKSRTVRIAVAANPAAGDETIERLLTDKDEVTRLASAGNLGNRPHLQSVVAKSSEKWMRAILAHTFARQDERSLPYDVQAALAKDDFYETRQRVAETTSFLDLFETLLNDRDARVRAGCAGNPRITREQMESLVTDRTWGVRASTATAGLRYPDDEQLLRLARDRSAYVRWAVLFRPDRPREAIELIAEDSDEVNRQHALRALADDSNIMAPQVVEFARADRDRVMAVAAFEVKSS